MSAADRVADFLDAWARRRDRGDLVYGIEDEYRLTVADLRKLVGVATAARDCRCSPRTQGTGRSLPAGPRPTGRSVRIGDQP